MAATLALASTVSHAQSTSPTLTPPTEARPTAAAPTPPPAAEAQAPAVVRFRGADLFKITTPFGAFTADERARAVEQRLAAVANRPGFDPHTITVVERESSSDITAGETILHTVTDADAREADEPRARLAAERADSIRTGIERGSLRHALKTIAIGVAGTLLATVLFIALLRLIARLAARTDTALAGWQTTWIPELRIQRLVLLPRDGISRALRLGARLLRWVVTLVLLYAYLSTVLSLFPWTRGLASQLLAYLVEPLATFGRGLIVYVPKLFAIAVVAILTRVVLKLVALVFQGIENGTIEMSGFYPEWAQPTYKIVRFLIIAFAIAFIYPLLPASDSAPFRGISVFLGVLFSLGSTSAVANVVAGVMITYMRPFQLGDRVQIADTTGDVVEKTLLVTRVRTTKNVDVTIPNSMVLGSHIINFSTRAQDAGLILHTSVTIGYDAPWRRVHELLIGAAGRTPHILAEPQPFVLQTSLDDWTVNYELNAYTDTPSAMPRTLSALHEAVQDAFAEAGVEIMSPQYLSLRDGNRSTVPEPGSPTG